jgi:hypothetical protein
MAFPILKEVSILTGVALFVCASQTVVELGLALKTGVVWN